MSEIGILDYIRHRRIGAKIARSSIIVDATAIESFENTDRQLNQYVAEFTVRCPYTFPANIKIPHVNSGTMDHARFKASSKIIGHIYGPVISALHDIAWLVENCDNEKAYEAIAKLILELEK